MDLDLPDFSGLSLPDLSDPGDGVLPDMTPPPDTIQPAIATPDQMGFQSATPPITDPYAIDPSQWDQETLNDAAFGDLHNMVDRHVQDYGVLPDSDTVDGFKRQISATWGRADAPDTSLVANDNLANGGLTQDRINSVHQTPVVQLNTTGPDFAGPPAQAPDPQQNDKTGGMNADGTPNAFQPQPPPTPPSDTQTPQSSTVTGNKRK